MCLRHRILTPLDSAPAYLSATQVQGSLIFTYCSSHMTLCTPDSFHILSPPLSACSFWLSRALALVSNKSKLLFKTFFYFYDSSKNCLGRAWLLCHSLRTGLLCFYPCVLPLPNSLCTSQVALLPTVASNSWSVCFGCSYKHIPPHPALQSSFPWSPNPQDQVAM